MKYYSLYPEDSPHNHFLFEHEDESGKFVCRPEYRDLQCRACGKLDEYTAIQRPIPADLIIRSKRNYVGFSDDFGIAVDACFRQIVEDNNLRGLRFIPVPGDTRYSLLIPEVIMPVDPALAGFEYHGGKCGSCGRPRESTVGPLIAGVRKPDDLRAIFTVAESSESIKGRRLSLFCSAEVAKILKAARVSGLDIIEAL